ncbi:annexin A13, partial [Reticulomyxa filosa]
GDVKKLKKELIAVMTSITNAQRQELKQKFVTTAKNLKKVPLESAIHTALGKRGKTTSILVTMLTPTADYRAQMLHEGLKQLPLLIEVICTCTNQQLQETIRAYSTLFKHDMLQDVHKATKSKKNLNSMLSTILKANRPESSQVNVAEAIQDATLLKEKGETAKPDPHVWE